MIVYDLETYNINRVVPLANSINRLSDFSGEYNGDITRIQYEKCRKGCVVFEGTDSSIGI